ncbi:MAG: hypothetical protein ACC700_16895, partial [Anaerolineales bacterium]
LEHPNHQAGVSRVVRGGGNYGVNPVLHQIVPLARRGLRPSLHRARLSRDGRRAHRARMTRSAAR